MLVERGATVGMEFAQSLEHLRYIVTKILDAMTVLERLLERQFDYDQSGIGSRESRNRGAGCHGLEG